MPGVSVSYLHKTPWYFVLQYGYCTASARYLQDKCQNAGFKRHLLQKICLQNESPAKCRFEHFAGLLMFSEQQFTAARMLLLSDKYLLRQDHISGSDQVRDRTLRIRH